MEKKLNVKKSVIVYICRFVTVSTKGWEIAFINIDICGHAYILVWSTYVCMCEWKGDMKPKYKQNFFMDTTMPPCSSMVVRGWMFQGCWLFLIHHFPRFLLGILDLWLKYFLLQEYRHAIYLSISKTRMKWGKSFKILIFGIEFQIRSRNLREKFEKNEK